MRVIISAGGTGGHIYPALAIVNKIKELEPNSEFIYIGTTDRMESKIVPKTGIKYEAIEMKGINRRNIFKNFKTLSCFLKAINKSKKIMKEFKPEIVLGIGGYITAPVIYAAHSLKIKTFIHEQNSIPGLSNKLLNRYADKIGVSLEGSLKYFNKDKVLFTGNPRSEEAINIEASLKSDYGLSSNKKLVLITMGSLGSLTMNKKFKEMLPNFDKKPYEVLFVTGKEYYEDFKDLKIANNVKVVEYLNNSIGIMKKADLIVSRAGASYISEMTALGLPAILIPSPYVTNNHQEKNAEELGEAKAAIIIKEKELTEELLFEKIDYILNNNNTYDIMKKNMKKLAVTNSATKIYNIIKKMLEEGQHG